MDGVKSSPPVSGRRSNGFGGSSRLSYRPDCSRNGRCPRAPRRSSSSVPRQALEVAPQDRISLEILSEELKHTLASNVSGDTKRDGFIGDLIF